MVSGFALAILAFVGLGLIFDHQAPPSPASADTRKALIKVQAFVLLVVAVTAPAALVGGLAIAFLVWDLVMWKLSVLGVPRLRAYVASALPALVTITIAQALIAAPSYPDVTFRLRDGRKVSAAPLVASTDRAWLVIQGNRVVSFPSSTVRRAWITEVANSPGRSIPSILF